LSAAGPAVRGGRLRRRGPAQARASLRTAVMHEFCLNGCRGVSQGRPAGVRGCGGSPLPVRAESLTQAVADSLRPKRQQAEGAGVTYAVGGLAESVEEQRRRAVVDGFQAV